MSKINFENITNKSFCFTIEKSFKNGVEKGIFGVVLGPTIKYEVWIDNKRVADTANLKIAVEVYNSVE